MIKIGICDDIAEQLQIQNEIVQNITCRMSLNAEIGCFRNGEELLWEIGEKGNMDIIFMDIEMGDMSGIETAKIIRDTDNRVILIFISCYDQYCKEIISVQPFAFIDKPASEKQIEMTLKHAFKVLREKEELFEYTYKKVLYKILVRKIRFFESDRRMINIYSTDGVNSFYRKLDEVENQLKQAGMKFLRINKSYLVNMAYIKEFRYEKIIMDDGKELNIGRRYKNKIRERYMKELDMN